MRKLMNIWVPIVLLVAILTTVYLRQWFLTARTIRATQELQKTDIRLLMQARESIQDVSNLMIALRVKLLGPESAEEAVLSSGSPGQAVETLRPSVVSAMKRHAVRLVFYKQTGKSAQMQFMGPYNGMVRFLAAARPDMPRLDGFLMQRGDGHGPNSVKLTVSFPVQTT